jgi:hypothetical protein
MEDENRESRSSDDLIRRAKERLEERNPDLDQEVGPDEADAEDLGAEHETASGTSPVGSERKPAAAPPDAIAAEEEPERRWKRTLGRAVWVIALGVFIASRFGLFGDLLADPTGEQVLELWESELKSGGLSDDTWACIESELREAGHVENLNDLSVSEIEKAFESPSTPAPSQLVEFLEGVNAYANPHQPTTCVSTDELATLQRPALLLVLTAGVQGAEIKQRTSRCDVGYDETPSYDDTCRVINVYDPNAGYTLVLHGQVPSTDLDVFTQSGVSDYQTDCFAAFLFVVEDDHSPVWTDSIRHFTPEGEMTEACVHTSA